MSSYTFILIHSPLVGPYTWRPVANVLQARGHTAIVPKLLDNPHATNPYWQQEVASVIDQLDVQTLQAPVILVAHSGAGVLLPAIRHAINHPISLCIFVDAGLPPEHSQSRLDTMHAEDSAWASALELELMAGTRYPDWTDSQLQDIIPDAAVRQRLLSEVQPRDKTFFMERIPVFDGWKAAMCAYLGLSETYKLYYQEAVRQGWQTQWIESSHFYMLVNPSTVADVLIGFSDATRN